MLIKRQNVKQSVFVYLHDCGISITKVCGSFHLIDLSSTRQRNKFRVTLQCGLEEITVRSRSLL